MPRSSAYISTHVMGKNGACINKFSCKRQRQIGVFLVWQQQKYHTNCCQSVNKKELYNTKVEIGETDSRKTFISAMCTTVHYGKWTLSWQVHHLASVHFWQVLFLAMCWMRIGHCTLYIGHCTLDIAHWTLHIGHCTSDIGCAGSGAQLVQICLCVGGWLAVPV